MAEMETGQGNDTVVTPTGDTGELDRMKTELVEATSQITRLKGTQASNDRALQALKTENEQLKTKVLEFEKDITARDTDITATLEQIESLKTQAAEAESLKVVATEAQLRAERMQIVAELAASNPAIAILAKTGALPAAETNEEFTNKLKTISDSIGATAKDQMNSLLSGGKPNPVPASGKDADTLEEEGYKLIMQQKGDEGIKLIREAWALRELAGKN